MLLPTIVISNFINGIIGKWRKCAAFVQPHDMSRNQEGRKSLGELWSDSKDRAYVLHDYFAGNLLGDRHWLARERQTKIKDNLPIDASLSNAAEANVKGTTRHEINETRK
jgi:hypothetical protein